MNNLQKRKFKNVLFTFFLFLMSFIVVIPLISVFVMLLIKGWTRLDFVLFTELPPVPGLPSGGAGNAIFGTLMMVGISVLLSVPIGILSGIFLSEWGDSYFAFFTRMGAKVLTGLPSILAGLFAYVGVVLVTGTSSAIAGGFALSILMLPIITLATEQAIRQVPQCVREAAFALGASKSQVICKALIPHAKNSILISALLASARAAGETAPLLFTAQFSYYWATNPMEATPSLAVLIYNFADSPFGNQLNVAWSASFLLVVFIFIINMAKNHD